MLSKTSLVRRATFEVNSVNRPTGYMDPCTLYVNCYSLLVSHNLRIVPELLWEEPDSMEPRVLHEWQVIWNVLRQCEVVERLSEGQNDLFFKVTLTIVILDWVSYTFSTLHFHPVPSLFSSSVSPFVILRFLLLRSLFSFSFSFFLLAFLLFPFSYRFSLFLYSIHFNVSSKTL